MHKEEHSIGIGQLWELSHLGPDGEVEAACGGHAAGGLHRVRAEALGLLARPGPIRGQHPALGSTNHSSPGLQIVARDGDTRPRGPRPRLVPAQPLVNARVFAILLLKQKLN